MITGCKNWLLLYIWELPYLKQGEFEKNKNLITWSVLIGPKNYVLKNQSGSEVLITSWENRNWPVLTETWELPNTGFYQQSTNWANHHDSLVNWNPTDNFFLTTYHPSFTMCQWVPVHCGHICLTSDFRWFDSIEFLPCDNLVCCTTRNTFA